MTQSRVPFLEAVEDVTRGNKKILQSEFLDSGALAVVDQGKAHIAGYTDSVEARVKQDSPVVVFGDHTRAFKYVDFPFALGADGVKVLRPREGVDPKFLFHYLRSRTIPSAGYSRHFKFLRELEVPRPPMGEQRRIAAILDHADALRTKRRQSLAHLDDLTQSIFHAMFSDSPTDSTLGDVSEVQGGLQVTRKRANHPLEVPYLRVANVFRNRVDLTEVKQIRVTQRELDRVRLQPDDVLVVEGHGNRGEIGRAARWPGMPGDYVHQNHLIRVRMDSDKLLPTVLEAWLNSPVGRRHLLGAANTTSGLNTISTSDVRRVPVPTPSLEVQCEFVARAAGVRSQRTAVERALAADDELFASLQSRAFSGGL